MCPRTFRLSGLKRLCHSCLDHFADKANYAFLCATEINVQEEITCKRQNNSFMSNKYISQAIIQNVTNTKSELCKTIRLTSQLISFQKLTMCIRFCPFVPSFVFAVLLIPSLNVLSDYFFVCHFGGSCHCLNFDKTRDAAVLTAR